MELAESELKFTSIADEALIGVYILQKDGKVTYGNKNFYEMLGITDSRTEVNFRDYIHPEDMPKVDSLSQLLISSDEGMTHYYRIIKKDGLKKQHVSKIKLGRMLVYLQFLCLSLSRLIVSKKRI